MRPFHHVSFALLLVALYLTVCSAQRHHIRPRQESSDLPVASSQPSATFGASHVDTSAVASTESPSAPSDTATSGSDAASPKASASLTVTSASAASATSTTEPESSASTDGAPLPSGAITASGAAASSTAVVYSGEGLPLQPKITPAIGIAGIVLIATGFIYTLIGIKKRWILISLSTAYLVALAVTVLIVYVMNPPVTDAVQGAFFVASCVTGMIFGAAALIFPDVTDGLGCLLGGFCVSMWLLVLKDGGLITSTTGKAIFIALMSLAGLSLSFSHYTRSYGLIFCTSFAGATVIILGTDCYSRAGLKEFWLYLWDLNDNTFPLNTNTYPITRGIRVEIACTVVICLLGLFSQFRLWKVVKEKREAKATERREQERDRDLEEEEIGRRVEKTTNRERVHWEAVYGGKEGATVKHTDSGIDSATGSLRKGTVSVREFSRSNSGSEGMEMDDLGAARDGSEQDLLSRPQSEAPKEYVQQVDTEGNAILEHNFSSRRSSATRRKSVRKSAEADTSTQRQMPNSMPEMSNSSSVPPPPPIVPLPFVVPTGDDDDAMSPFYDQLSIASAMPVDVNRLSVFSAGQRLSRPGTNASRDSLIIPHFDDDRASSIAATLDEMNEDVYSLPALSRVSTPWGEVLDPFDVPLPPSPYPGEDSGRAATEAFPEIVPEQQGDRRPKDQDVHKPQQAFLELAPAQSLTKSTDPHAEPVQGSKRFSLNERRRHSEVSTRLDEDQADQGPTRPRTQSDAAQSVAGSLSEHLPDKLSKVMLSYRTNEWAKHLTLAEQPELEAIPEPSSPGIIVDHSFSQVVDSTVPAREEKHRSARISKDFSQLPHTNPYRQSIMRSSSSQSEYEAPASFSRQSSAAAVSPPHGTKPLAQRASSALSTPVYSSRSASSAAPRGIRSSSTPLMQTLAEQTVAESPIEENAETVGYTTSPIPSNTLMGRREQLINNKMSTMSFATPNIAISAPSDSGSLRRLSQELDGDNISLTERKQLLEEEDMPLSKRRHLIQQQQQQQQQRLSSQNLQRHSHQSQPRTASWATPMPTFDSHQPNRSPSGMDAGKREVMMANWRQAVRQDLQPAQTKKADESHRQAMIASTRNQQMAQQQQSMAASYRENMMDSVMRRGDMLDLHQQALRRMQAAANKHAG